MMPYDRHFMEKSVTVSSESSKNSNILIGLGLALDVTWGYNRKVFMGDYPCLSDQVLSSMKPSLVIIDLFL